MNHTTHFMQETSLYNYFQWTDQEIDHKFRQEIKQYIIKLLRNQNLTDREIADRLGYKDPNKVRPRRNELSKKDIVIESGKRICTVGNKQSIVWKLNPERLVAYLNG